MCPTSSALHYRENSHFQYKNIKLFTHEVYSNTTRLPTLKQNQSINAIKSQVYTSDSKAMNHFEVAQLLLILALTRRGLYYQCFRVYGIHQWRVRYTKPLAGVPQTNWSGVTIILASRQNTQKSITRGNHEQFLCIRYWITDKNCIDNTNMRFKQQMARNDFHFPFANKI